MRSDIMARRTNSGIEAESLPLMDFVDSCTESCSNSEIFDISPQEFKMEEQEVDEDEEEEEEEEVQELDKKEKNIKQQDFKKPSSSTELRTPGGRRRTPESPRNLFVRKIPDFSKVAPRVLFPKDNVLRSMSKRPPVWDSLSPDFPQNPAAFARDVLLNTIDGASNIKVQQAIALVEQLQENYDRLLTKHAEAENTIDRLRVGAKVNLFSELPKPSPVVQSGLNFNPSKLVTLDFPRAQRVELHSDSPQANEQEMNFSKGTQITPEVLRSQAEKFFHQLYSFEEILKNDSCQPVKQIKGLLQVVEELNSLERGYLLAMDEDAFRQQRGEETNPFDRERDLEQLIGRFRLHVEGLKEQVEEMLVEESKCEATQSSSPQPPPLSVPSEEEDDEEVEEEEEEGEESDRHPKSSTPSSEVPAKAEPDVQDCVGDSSTQPSRRSSPPSNRASLGFSPVSVHQSSRPVWAQMRKSHSSSLSSLGETTAAERMDCKVHKSGSRRENPQDGIISPEMDSGFLGSESSHFTGAVAPSLLHQVSSQRYNEHLIGEVRQCMKNLKEMMERKIQDEPSCEPPHYPHFRHAPPSSAMSWEDKESHRQPLSALSRRCSVSAPLKVEPRSAESEHRESFLGHGSTLRSNRFNAPPPHSTSIPPPVQHLRTKLKEPKRSSPRHQVASQRPAKTSPPEEFGEVRRTVHTPMDTSCLLRQNKLLRQNSYSVSDDEHSDLHTGSVQSNYSSISSSTPTAPHHHHHDDPFKVLDSTHPISHQCEAQGPIDDFNEVRRTAQSPPESVYKVRQTKLQQKSTADETDNRTHHHRLIGSECWAHQRERSKRAAGGHDTPTHSSSVCCRLCPHRRDSNPDSLRQINHQPAVSSGGGTKKRPSAAAAPAPTSLPHCTLLGQPVLLYSLPLCLSPSKSTSTPLEVGGQRESEAGLRRCFSADQLCSLDLSLNRAIRAAQRMKHTSRHMARTQALGLQYQNLLSR